MKKVLKNILKWLLCVFITFAVLFTLSQLGQICIGVYFRTNFLGNYEEFINFIEGDVEESVKWYDEIMDRQYENNNDDGWFHIMSKLYPEYPAGVTRIICIMASYMNYGNITIVVLTLAIIIGTAIYMLQDVDKKGVKIVVVLYILSIAILGLVQGFVNTTGENLTLIDIWEFPDEYIVPVTIAFIIVVIVRFIRQKDIAKKLNEKLKALKEEKENK